MPHYKEGCKSRWSKEDRVLKNLTKINQKRGHTSTTLLIIQPYENQKFWTPIQSSDVGLLLGATLRNSEVLVPYQKF
jgi:hypothetical protein